MLTKEEMLNNFAHNIEEERMIKGIRDPRLMRYIYLVVKDAISENIDR